MVCAFSCFASGILILAFVVFGVELEYLLQRDAGGMDLQPGAIPIVIDRLIAYVENKGLTDVGICEYRFVSMNELILIDHSPRSYCRRSF